MLNLSNALSFSRAGFALAFLQENPLIRVLAIGLAMLSDFLDGYIARRQRTTTQFGAVLDPIMDKFFVFFAGGIFYVEGKLNSIELIALISRDLSLCLFGLYLGIQKAWKDYEVKSIWWGKITTAAQFVLLICLTMNVVFSSYVYALFIIMAALAFLELLLRFRKKTEIEQ